MCEYPFCNPPGDELEPWDVVIFETCKLINGETKEACVLFCLGSISLLLTVINVVAILVFGWLILRLKEVTPESVPQSFPYFWKKDVSTYRKHGNATEETIRKESDKVFGIDESKNNGLAESFKKNLVEKIKQDDDYRTIRKMNINSTKRTNTRKIGCYINSNENAPSIAPIPEDIFRSSTSSDLFQKTKRYSRCPKTPTIDTILYHQAEMLEKSSQHNMFFQQLPNRPICGTPGTAPI